MRRLLLALFAFLLGFGGAIAAAQLTGAANTRSQGYPLGTIDLDRYCQSMYGERAIPLLSRPTASGWPKWWTWWTWSRRASPCEWTWSWTERWTGR